MGSGALRGLFFMSTPALLKLTEGNQMVWCVEYAGMRRCHRQDWQAKWLYDYCIDLYGSKLIINQDGPA